MPPRLASSPAHGRLHGTGCCGSLASRLHWADRTACSPGRLALPSCCRALRNPWRVRLLHEINNGNRLSAGTLAHLQAAARGPRQRAGSGPPAGGSGSFSN